MTIRTLVYDGTVDASGDLSDDIGPISGELLDVVCLTDGLTAGADLTMQQVHTGVDGAVDLGELIVNNGDVGTANVFLTPRRAAQDNAGTDLVYASTDVVPVPYVVSGLLRLVVANGGNATSFRIIVRVRE